MIQNMVKPRRASIESQRVDVAFEDGGSFGATVTFLGFRNELVL
jgi:hypothetical protein